MDDWGHQIAINFEFDARTIKLKTHRQKPYVQFRVVLISDDEDLLNESQSKALETAYMWIFDSHHPERVRYLCAKEVWSQWKKATPTPYFLIPKMLKMNQVYARRFGNTVFNLACIFKMASSVVSQLIQPSVTD